MPKAVSRAQIKIVFDRRVYNIGLKSSELERKLVSCLQAIKSAEVSGLRSPEIDAMAKDLRRMATTSERKLVDLRDSMRAVPSLKLSGETYRTLVHNLFNARLLISRIEKLDKRAEPLYIDSVLTRLSGWDELDYLRPKR